MNIVITGTSRGIGLELVRQAKDRGARILAVARKPEASDALRSLNVETLALDLTDVAAPTKLADAVSDWESVDLLINNAGVYRKDQTVEDFLGSFHINSVVPYFLTQALLPSLKRSPAAKVVHITSKMGSITDNTSGGSYSYRSSKTALNMINMSLSRDHRWLTSVVVHPGWVQTEMGGANAPVTARDSASGIFKVIDRLKTDDSGRFYDFRGETLPW